MSKQLNYLWHDRTGQISRTAKDIGLIADELLNMTMNPIAEEMDSMDDIETTKNNDQRIRIANDIKQCVNETRTQILNMLDLAETMRDLAKDLDAFVIIKK